MNRCSKCLNCKYYEVIYSKILNKPVPACNLPKDTKGKCMFARK